MAKQQKEPRHEAKEPKPQRQPAKDDSASAAGKAPEKEAVKRKGMGSWPWIIPIAIIVIAVVLLLYYPGLIGISGVPFSTFKSNLNAAQKISLIITYGNNSQYSSEAACFPQILEILGRSRSPSTIGLYILNKTTCTYSKTGLGGSVQPVTANSSYCIGAAKGTPTIYLNYSNTNYTLIMPYGMYIYGNSGYMSKCPVAADFA